MGILAAIGVVGTITKAIAGVRTERLNAKTEEAKLDAEQRMALLYAQRDIHVAEAGNMMTSWVRPAFAGIFWIYLAKVLVWDKVLGWGVTDSLSGNQQEIMMIIVGFYFLARPFEKIWKK